MLDTLFTYLEKTGPISTDDKELIRSIFQQRQLLKGEFFLREGEPAKLGAFVARGFLRSFVIDDKGKEHIIQFAPENWWISDKTGIQNGSAATFFIDAIEDSYILTIDLAGHMTLLQKVSTYAASFQSGIQKRGVAKDKRIVNTLTATAEERYADFLENYPSIAQRVPQHMLASYLGITPETLSRVRRRNLGKK